MLTYHRHKHHSNFSYFSLALASNNLNNLKFVSQPLLKATSTALHRDLLLQHLLLVFLFLQLRHPREPRICDVARFDGRHHLKSKNHFTFLFHGRERIAAASKENKTGR